MYFFWRVGTFWIYSCVNLSNGRSWEEGFCE
jgi:hypothetical protein